MGSSLKVGDEREVRVKITDKMVRQFAEMSGDNNPIHLDEAFAKTTRFGRRIAHGMLTGALISRALTSEFGDGGVYLGQTLKFVSPVYIDEDIRIQLLIRAAREEKGILFVETNVTKTNGDIVAKGEATIMVPEAVVSKKQ
jgi:3-hydroxybutyryl-CoA dehydratase